MDWFMHGFLFASGAMLAVALVGVVVVLCSAVHQIISDGLKLENIAASIASKDDMFEINGWTDEHGNFTADPPRNYRWGPEREWGSGR